MQKPWWTQLYAQVLIALTLGVALSTMAITVLLWLAIPKGFFPLQDNGIIQGTVQAPQSPLSQPCFEPVRPSR